MNEITQQYVNWKLKNQDKYSSMVIDKDTTYTISLDEFVQGHENSTKYSIKLQLSNIKSGFISFLYGKELLKAYYTVCNNIEDSVCSLKLLSIIFKQIHNVYTVFRKYKITKLFLCDVLKDNSTNNPVAIIMYKTEDNQYIPCPMSFVYLIFLTKAYKKLLVNID